MIQTIGLIKSAADATYLLKAIKGRRVVMLHHEEGTDSSIQTLLECLNIIATPINSETDIIPLIHGNPLVVVDNAALLSATQIKVLSDDSCDAICYGMEPDDQVNWISMEEREPTFDDIPDWTDGDWFLVRFKSAVSRKSIVCPAIWTGRYFSLSASRIFDVTHWMPMPKPPEEEEELT